MQARIVNAGRGVEWITQGVNCFRRQPKAWFAMGSVFMVGFIIVVMIPVIGMLLASMIAPVFVSGMLQAARDVEAGRPIEFGYLLRGFNEPKTMNKLLIIGGVLVAGSFISMIIGFIAIGGAMLSAANAVPMSVLSSLGGLIGVLLMLAIQLATTMATVYAIPLVTFQDMPAGDAMRASFNACMRNALPLLVFGLAYAAVAIAASIVFGFLVAFLSLIGVLLGIVASGAIGAASVCIVYASYRDCFDAPSAG